MKVMDEITKQLPGLFLLVGKSKSGKSYFLKYLLQYYCLYKRIFNFGLVLTGSEYNHEYPFLPQNAVGEFSEEKLMQYINQLKERKSKGNGKPLPASFIVLDDCLGLVQQTKSWQSLISTFRHLNISIFISVQYLKASQISSTLIREQTNVLIAFRSTNINTIRALYDYYGSDIFETLDEFRKRYSACTQEKYHALVYISDDQLADPDKNFISMKVPEIKLQKIVY